jgi:hypothetical protein
LYVQLKRPPWRQVPAGARQHDRGHSRDEHRTLKAVTVAAGLAFPHAAQAIAITRHYARNASCPLATLGLIPV